MSAALAFFNGLTDEERRRLAHLLLPYLIEELPTSEPTASPSEYLTVTEAAQLLRCRRQRVDDLLSQRRLTRLKDGRRTLLIRAEIEAHIAASAMPRR